MAAICALAGLLFHLLTDHDWADPLAAWRQAGATFVVIATVGFVLTVERKRLEWSIYFALGWGLVVALVGWFTAGYNHKPTIFEWPFLSGIFAVLLAAPLFQTMRDEGRASLAYRRLHGHAWTDAVIGAASLVFVGISFALAWLIAGLFDLIGIEAIKDLLEEEWFGAMLAGFSFGAAVGLLRERDALVGTLQRLVMVVLSVLAPVLGVALVAFLASVPFTGLDELWESVIPATPLMLVAAAGAILLANAVIGDGVEGVGEEERPANRALRYAAPALVLTVLPLAIIAAVSLGQRIGQYGWTPERIWGVVAVGVAAVYGIAGWWSVFKGRAGFDDVLRPLQTRMALGLCGIALLLALPIVDFGAISARSQLARLESGSLRTDEFDWAAMAFDFGPSGRARLAEVAKSGAADQRGFAAAALKEDDRYTIASATEARREGRAMAARLRLASPDIVMTDEIREAIGKEYACRRKDDRCVLMRIGPERFVLVTTSGKKRRVSSSMIDLADVRRSRGEGFVAREQVDVENVDLDKARIEVRDVRQRQLVVDGKDVGQPFD
jgi:multisubunit Na+/H+ antiporter MnhG subunit